MGMLINQAIFGALNQLKAGKETAIGSLRLAIANGGDVNAHGWGHGLTPLMRWTQILAESDDPGGMLPIIILLEAGADPLKKDKRKEMSAIEYARQMKFDGIVEAMERHMELNDLYKQMGITRRS